MFDGRAQQRVDLLLEHDLARDRLRDLEDGCEIEVLDRRPDGGGRNRREDFLPKPWVLLVELPHFSVGSPTNIALASVPQVRIRDRVQAAGRVEARRNLASERLDMDEAVGAGRADRLFVELLVIERATFDARELRTDQRGAVFEVCRAVLGP